MDGRNTKTKRNPIFTSIARMVDCTSLMAWVRKVNLSDMGPFPRKTKGRHSAIITENVNPIMTIIDLTVLDAQFPNSRPTKTNLCTFRSTRQPGFRLSEDAAIAASAAQLGSLDAASADGRDLPEHWPCIPTVALLSECNLGGRWHSNTSKGTGLAWNRLLHPRASASDGCRRTAPILGHCDNSQIKSSVLASATSARTG